MGEIKLKWHIFWEQYHYNWLIKNHGKFPESRAGLSAWVDRHLTRYWHHRVRNI